MARRDPPGVTTEDILCTAKELIAKWGWRRGAWPAHGPLPRCIRAALWTAAEIEGGVVGGRAHTDASRRISEAIYDKRGNVGGIMDWEYRKRTNQESVVAMLQKAIEMGPSEREIAVRELYPT